jgi:hypothetical protein
MQHGFPEETGRGALCGLVSEVNKAVQVQLLQLGIHALHALRLLLSM